jgi:hypothetical protein
VQEGDAQQGDVQEEDLTDAWSEGEGEEAGEYVYKRSKNLEDEPMFECPSEKITTTEGAYDLCMIDVYNDMAGREDEEAASVRDASGLAAADEDAEVTDCDF